MLLTAGLPLPFFLFLLFLPVSTVSILLSSSLSVLTSHTVQSGSTFCSLSVCSSTGKSKETQHYTKCVCDKLEEISNWSGLLTRFSVCFALWWNARQQWDPQVAIISSMCIYSQQMLNIYHIKQIISSRPKLYICCALLLSFNAVCVGIVCPWYYPIGKHRLLCMVQVKIQFSTVLILTISSRGWGGRQININVTRQHLQIQQLFSKIRNHCICPCCEQEVVKIN